MLELLKRYRYLIMIIALPYILFVILLVTPTKKSVTLPGDVSSINSYVSINNGYNQSGNFYSTFVMSRENITLFQQTLCQALNEAYIYDYDPNYNYLEDQLLSKINKENSISNAIICAYNFANIPLDYEFLGIVVTETKDYSSFEVGDIILGDSRANILENLEKSRTQGLNVNIIRTNFLKTEELSITPNIENELYGIGLLNRSYYDCYKINNPEIVITPNSVGGPSGGLLQALSIYNQLVEFDYTRGLKIAGTGTISTNGDVGVIGGIKQKIYTAAKAKCDVFFSPDGDVESYEHQNFLDASKVIEEANEKYNSNMKLIPVRNISEAINYLKNYEN